MSLTLLQTLTRWLIMQKARGRAGQARHASTAFKRRVSGSLSLLYSRYFSPFPHGTGSLSVSGEYLALEDGPPSFRQDFSCPALLRNRFRGLWIFDDRALTFFGDSFQNLDLIRTLP